MGYPPYLPPSLGLPTVQGRSTHPQPIRPRQVAKELLKGDPLKRGSFDQTWAALVRPQGAAQAGGESE